MTPGRTLCKQHVATERSSTCLRQSVSDATTATWEEWIGSTRCEPTMVLGELAGVGGNTCSGASSTSVSSTDTFCFDTTLLAEELQTEVIWTNKKIETEILLQIAGVKSLESYRENGLTPRRKRSGGRVECDRTLSYDDILRVKTFIINYAEEHALVLPGRVPGYKRGDRQRSMR